MMCIDTLPNVSTRVEGEIKKEEEQWTNWEEKKWLEGDVETIVGTFGRTLTIFISLRQAGEQVFLSSRVTWMAYQIWRKLLKIKETAGVVEVEEASN